MGRKKARKGFKRSAKQWEESIATHIGKFIDRLTVNDILNVLAFGSASFAAYMGIEAIEKVADSVDLSALLLTLSPALTPFVPYILFKKADGKISPAGKIIPSILAGYAVVKLGPSVIQTVPIATP